MRKQPFIEGCGMLFSFFQRQHFGYSQVARKYMNQQAEQLTERIG